MWLEYKTGNSDPEHSVMSTIVPDKERPSLYLVYFVYSNIKEKT